MVKISSARIDMESARIDNALLKDYGEILVGGAAGADTGAAFSIDLSAGNMFKIIVITAVVETFGHQTLTFNGAVDTSATHGVNGTLLLDPLDATISANSGPRVISTSNVVASLATGDVIITTGQTGTDVGNITVARGLGGSALHSAKIGTARRLMNGITKKT